MSYYYEALDDERFQKLAQSVLVHAFPDLQAFPVGQPDGGRDAIAPIMGTSKKRVIVFQVKFSRSPSVKDGRSAIESVIASEKEKVEELRARGATAYYLITNVKGTAHFDTGSIDRVNAALSDAFGMPSFCWWRDDLDARINALSDIKWSFPDIIRGSDLLQLLVESGLRESAENRSAAIRAYLATQYKDDEEVKFKQVELQNKLLDLFVDLPIGPQGSRIHRAGQLVHRWGELGRTGYWSDSRYVVIEHSYWEAPQAAYYNAGLLRPGEVPTAAAALLNYELETSPHRIVLEGAPGQGKSTITQYVCQVNRIRLLDQTSQLENLPENHRFGPIRIPFRIDLRDFASWILGRNPFSIEGGREVGQSSSLESFLAAQVSHASGGHAFSVNDFTAVAKASHVLLVLDGFDEVADIPTRQKIVEEISRASTRIQANARSALIVVTSRPAAFANSPGFPEDEWRHLEIQFMTPQQINSYAKKWMEARHLAPRDKIDFSKLLSEKLEQPHMRDLARNPMQLTILLALIQYARTLVTGQENLVIRQLYGAILQ